MDLKGIKLNHPKLFKALQTVMRMFLLDPAFEIDAKRQAKLKKIKLGINEGEGCYTNFDRIVLGLLFPLFNGTIDEQYNTARTILGHEVGHIHFTDKTVWNRFVFKAMREYGPLAEFAKDILNIVEDRRIERLMGMVSEFLQKNFFLLGYRSTKDTEKEINDQLKKEAPNSMMKLLFIRNALLYISYTRILPNLNNPEIMEYLKQCYPYVLYARQAKDTEGAVHATEKILEVLKPLIDEFKSSSSSSSGMKITAIFKSKEVGTTDPSGSGSLKELTDKFEAVELPKELEEMLEKLVEEAKKEIEGEDEKDDTVGGFSFDEEEDDEKEGKGKDKGKDDDEIEDEESDDEDGKSGKSSEKEESDDEDKTSASSKSKDDSDEDESEEGKGEGSEEGKEKSSSPSVDSKTDSDEGKSKEAELKDLVENITHNLEAMEKAIKDEIESSSKEFEEGMNEPVTKTILEDLFHSDKNDKKQTFREKREHLKIEDLNPVIDTELHKRCRPYFKDRNAMEKFTRFEYEQLLSTLNLIVRKTVQQIREISQMCMEDTLRNQRYGKLDRRSITDYLAFNERKIFKNKEIEKKQLEMEVMLLVDVSGSNSSQMLNKKNDTYVPRYVMNQTVAIVLHEILKKLRFPHTIWTFYEDTVEKQMFSSIVDRGNCFDKDAGLYLKEVGAYYNNRDGYSIRYAGEYLNKFSQHDNRLLIVLSDGQPAASGYGGKKAMEDVKQAVLDVQNKGSKVVGIFTGHESENEYFRYMYDNYIFCNNESIFELPKMLKSFLINEFQDYLNKIG